MNFNHFDTESMKQNMDANIPQFNQNRKQSADKQSISTKRELFREINSDNPSKQIKKAAYIVDSDQEQSPERFDRKQCKSHRSIDQVSEIIESLSRDASVPTSPKNQPLILIDTCSTHNQGIFSYNFCVQCASYLLCPSCIKENHSSHMTLTFSSEQETKYLTKQFLIQKIEETLQKLKSKENDIKNKSTQMELIASNVKRMEQDVMNKLQIIFGEIGNMVRNVYEKEQMLYERRIDEFYQTYNGVGDELRENLLTIIEQSFEIKSFDPSWICKQPPTIPNQQISKFKSTLQKTKKFYKTIMDSLDELKQKTFEGSKLSNTKMMAKSSVASRQASTKKYEKFLSDSCYNDNGQANKSSLIKILDTLSK